jgi:hypothetical protein
MPKYYFCQELSQHGSMKNFVGKSLCDLCSEVEPLAGGEFSSKRCPLTTDT